jgi:hypothetical protein
MWRRRNVAWRRNIGGERPGRAVSAISILGRVMKLISWRHGVKIKHRAILLFRASVREAIMFPSCGK